VAVEEVEEEGQPEKNHKNKQKRISRISCYDRTTLEYFKLK
jgi:hypothetical protein